MPRIVVACPKPNAALLAAAEMLGVSEILRIGGAQAIAAMAYGTKMIPRVDKIFGPGNRWVDAAKRIVSSDCAVDLSAGPTEVLVLAERGNPAWIAADLITQGEHDPDAVAVFVTASAKLAHDVAEAIEIAACGRCPRLIRRKSRCENRARSSWRQIVRWHLSSPTASRRNT